MTPSRTSAGYRIIDIDWSRKLGIRIFRSSETKSLREFNAIVAMLYELRQNGQIEVLRAFAQGRVSIAELKQAKRLNRLQSDSLLADLALFENLWSAIDRALPHMGRSHETRRRYFTSLKKLRQLGAKWLGDGAQVRDLERVTWRELRAVWRVSVRRRRVAGKSDEARKAGYVVEEHDASAADWNHLVRAISAFLSVVLGDVYHPVRRSIMKKIEREREMPRKPAIARGGLFWDLVNAAPEHAQTCFIVLGASGMRVGEYLKCGEEHLVPDEYAIDVPGGKTGAKRYYVAPEYWAWVAVGVPSPLRYGWLYKYFKRAARAVGHPELRPHDLRHLFAKVAKSEGVRTSDTQAALGHATSRITENYEREDVQADVAKAVGRGLTRKRAG
jgi:integrase